MQRVEQPIMTTGLERIAAKAREDRKLKFTSLAHHVTEELIWESVCHIPKNSAPGCDEQTVTEAKETFKQWAPEMLRAIHDRGYRPPPILRVFIPKPGKKEKRPLGIPCVADRALQRSVAGVLAAIYEQDFLPCSFGGRPGIGAHHALATLAEVIAGKPVSYVYEADLKNFFGSLDHGWLLRFLENRVGDPRIMSLVRRWLKAGILEDGELTANEKGTPQGGSISVLLSNLCLPHVLDLWFEKVVKPRLKGQAYLIRYIDDFVICFQYREDAERVQAVLGKRLDKFALALEPSKTKLTALMRDIRHWSLKDQVFRLNQVLRGHYAYYGVAGNWRSLLKVYRFVERYWHKMLCSRSWAARITWAVFHRLRDLFPLQRPTIYLTYGQMQACGVL